MLHPEAVVLLNCLNPCIQRVINLRRPSDAPAAPTGQPRAHDSMAVGKGVEVCALIAQWLANLPGVEQARREQERRSVGKR